MYENSSRGIVYQTSTSLKPTHPKQTVTYGTVIINKIIKTNHHTFTLQWLFGLKSLLTFRAQQIKSLYTAFSSYIIHLNYTIFDNPLYKVNKTKWDIKII